MGHVKKPGTPEYVMEWLDPGRNAGHTNMNWDDSDDPKVPAPKPDDDAESADEPQGPEVVTPPAPPPDPALGDVAPAEGEEGGANQTRDAGAAPENRSR